MTIRKIADPYLTLEHSRQFYRDMYVDSRPKLTLAKQCQVYACLHRGVRPAIVMRAFDLSRATVSYIGGCRDDDRKPTTIEAAGYVETIGGATIAARNPDRKPRYRAVADEFARLGEAEFLRAYFTDEVNRLIAKARYDFNMDKKSGRYYIGD